MVGQHLFDFWAGGVAISLVVAAFGAFTTLLWYALEHSPRNPDENTKNARRILIFFPGAILWVWLWPLVLIGALFWGIRFIVLDAWGNQ